VHRLLLSILLALALIGSPAAAAAPTAPDCTMTGMTGMPAKPAKSKMDCCTPGCLFASAAAVLPDEPNGEALAGRAAAATWPLASAGVHSVTPSALDPPPRTLT
jgi:hypothetical protein